MKLKRVSSLLTRFTLLALFTLVPLSSLSPASANSLTSSSPASGAVLVVAPTAVSVTAASPLLADGNQLSVVDPTGKAVDDGNITVSDVSALVGLKTLTQTGVYTVSYTLLAQGEAPLTGSYTFLYNAPDQMSQASATPSATKSESASKGGSSIFNGATLFVLLVFAAGCAMLAFLVWYARTLIHQAQKRKRKAAKKVTAPSRRRD